MIRPLRSDITKRESSATSRAFSRAMNVSRTLTSVWDSAARPLLSDVLLLNLQMQSRCWQQGHMSGGSLAVAVVGASSPSAGSRMHVRHLAVFFPFGETHWVKDH